MGFCLCLFKGVWVSVDRNLLPGVRCSILKGYSVWDMTGDLLVLIIYSVILMPVSIFIFKMALKRAKVNGSLAHY